jgi:LysM repeat protein
LEKKSLRGPLLLALALIGWSAGLAHAASLTPTRSGLLRQVHAARDHGLAYAYDDDDVVQMVLSGELVQLTGGDYLVKETVRQPFARPEVKLFTERLAAEYRAACGERMVVTSLVRPKTRQPRNASPLSVHPTGMAMDLRVPQTWACRSFLERTLTALEAKGVLEAARERRPPHYHVVLFPEPYLGYVVAIDGDGAVAGYGPPEVGPSAAPSIAPAVMTGGEYTVRRGDSLWAIARRFATTTTALQQVNGLRTTRLAPGQVLLLPGGAAAPAASVALTHRVRRGDSLWSIARSHGTTPQSLQRANGMGSTLLKPGQVLTVPAAGAAAASAPATSATYRVRRGDNLWDIARRHGTSPRQIQRANSLASSRIKPGQVLTIPAASP